MMVHGPIWFAVVSLLFGTLPFGGDREASITGLRLESANGATELTIELSEHTEFSEFTLADPARLIVDIEATSGLLSEDRYIVGRGGVNAIRYSQLEPGVIRVVIDLERRAAYAIRATQSGILVRLESGAGAFASWSSAAPASSDGVRATPSPAPNALAQAAAATPRATARTAVTAVPVDDQAQQRITVNYQGVDIHDVIASFAEFSGRSIVVGAGITGTVSVTIIEQPWDVALYTILNAHGLAAQELPSGIIQVDAIQNLQERQTVEPLVTQTFRINYVPVGEMATTLDPLRSDRGRVSTNPSTNTLIITDIPSVLADIAGIISQLDVRTPQVSIQAKIVFVNRTDVEELGITYDLKDSQGSSFNRLVSVPDPFDPGAVTSTDVVSLGGNSIAALGNANIRVQQPQLEAVLSLIIGRHTLIAFIDALQSQELSDVQAAPLITTLDNQPAEIWVGERTPIRVVDVGTAAVGGAGASAPRATAELVETGIRLRVTPTITADRRILMQLHAERSSAQLAATDIGVIFQQQQGTTRLMVEDGQTAVIGGLTVTETGSTRAGIPFLMDLPIIGRLFQTTRSREQQRDLLIMVTPRIVQDQG